MMPICKYPTTIVFVDDNEDFLQSLSMDLPYENASFKFFSHPKQAIQFLNNQSSHTDPISRRLLRTSESTPGTLGTPELNLQTLCHETLNDDRFNELSVVIVDYNMPFINGIELLSQIQNPYVIKILLTGEADEQIAVEAFNNSQIDRFIKKHQFLTHDQIHSAILDAQSQYFQNFSNFFTQALSLSPNLPSAIPTKEFQAMFNSIVAENNICEYYLFQHTGSFFMLTPDAKAYTLYTLNTDQLDDIALNIDSSLDKNLASDIKSKRAILCPKIETINKLPDSQDWKDLIHPCETLKAGSNNFYYKLLQSNGGINANAILPYTTYQESLTSRSFK